MARRVALVLLATVLAACGSLLGIPIAPAIEDTTVTVHDGDGHLANFDTNGVFWAQYGDTLELSGSGCQGVDDGAGGLTSPLLQMEARLLGGGGFGAADIDLSWGDGCRVGRLCTGCEFHDEGSRFHSRRFGEGEFVGHVF